MKTKVFAKKIKKSLGKIGKVEHNETIMMDGVEAEINDGMVFFALEYIGIYVRFTKEDVYLFTAEFKLLDSVEQIEEIIKKEMAQAKDRFNKVIDSLNNFLN